MIFQIVGYAAFVLLGLCMAAMTFIMLFFGGGDCGTLFGNWRNKEAIPTFFVLCFFTALIWYGIIMSCPFTISVVVK